MIIEIVVSLMKQSENCKQHPHRPFHGELTFSLLIIGQQLITLNRLLFFRDKMENVIKRIHRVMNMFHFLLTEQGCHCEVSGDRWPAYACLCRYETFEHGDIPVCQCG